MVSTLKVAASYGRHTGRRRCPSRLRGDRPGLGSVRLQRQQDKMLMLHRPSAISNSGSEVSVERPERVPTNQRSDRVRFPESQGSCPYATPTPIPSLVNTSMSKNNSRHHAWSSPCKSPLRALIGFCTFLLNFVHIREYLSAHSNLIGLHAIHGTTCMPVSKSNSSCL
jgi:hypothetical protein